MKKRLSQLILLVGIVVGMTAVWVGSTPFVGVNGPVLGGMFYSAWVDHNYLVATTLPDYDYCLGTTSLPCSEYGRYNCWGGNVTVAVSDSEITGLTIFADGLSACSGDHPRCTTLYDASCETY
ncbi:MAG TPA: hypothetical protein PKH24_03705 [Sedimentisphaerales bacterium]|jgi:hypothetical protein|nr:hypothetical protein [Sedimentisphaerales bacterium]HNU28630.1 hypothetical protein [Sedimentisphaerales bacterium]